MIIRGNTVCANVLRSDFAEQDPTRSSYILGKPDVAKAQSAADQAAKDAKAAQQTADAALAKTGGTMTGALNVIEPTENAHAANKGYVDEKRKLFTITLTVNGWEGNTAPFTQTIGIEGILSTDMPHYSAVYSADQETRLAQKEAFALVDDLDTADGSVTFTCFEDKPDVNIPIQMEVNR